MFKASKLIKNLIFLLLFIPSVSAHTEEQSLAEPQKPGQSQEIQSPSQEIPPLQQKQKVSFFNSQNFNFKEKRIFSLDTAYLLSGLKNNGWGLGAWLRAACASVSFHKKRFFPRDNFPHKLRPNHNNSRNFSERILLSTQ